MFIGFGAPHWPTNDGRTTGNPHLGPLVNETGMYLTVVSTQRRLQITPTPADLEPAAPTDDETPAYHLAAGPDEAGDFYWWVETIRAAPSRSEPVTASSALANGMPARLPGR